MVYRRVKSNVGEELRRISNVKQYVKKSEHADSISVMKYVVKIELLLY